MRRGCSIVLMAALLFSGCTSVRTVRPATDPRASSFGGAKVGDTVTAQLTDGRRVTFRIRAIEADALVGTASERYARADIVSLQRRVFSPTKTVILGAGIFALALLAATAAAMASLLGGG